MQSTRPKYAVMILLEEIGSFDSFTEAYRLFHEKIMEQIKQGGSLMLFEQTNFIVLKKGLGEVPATIFQVIDLAKRFKLVTEKGDLIDPSPEIPAEEIEAAFREVT